MEEFIPVWAKQIHSRITKLVSGIGILGLTTCLMALLTLGKLFEETWEKQSFQFDTSILMAIHHWANPLLDQMMLGITRLGNGATVLGVIMGTIAWLAWKQRYRQAIFFSIACMGALILTEVLKLSFAKPRPQLWPQLITESSFSFPSGHALGSLVVYGFLAFLLASHRSWHPKLIYGIATIVIGLIGFSRLYLGVHWPTDVIAGFAVGLLWLMTCIFMLIIQTQKLPQKRFSDRA